MTTSDTRPSSAIKDHLRRYRTQWEANAKLDALWAGPSLDDKLGGRWDEQAFFQTGQQEIDEVFLFMQRSGITEHPIERALDFGCGVGRLTGPLATRARQVVGIDISGEMIRRARAYFPNITFHLNEKDDLSDFENQSIDLIYTNIVLQHLNNDLQRHYICEFSRLLRPEGLVIFQIPGRPPIRSRKLRTLTMLASLRPRTILQLATKAVLGQAAPWRARMELNTLPKAEVIRVASSCRLELEAIGNINWKVFYAANRFQLEAESNELDDQTEFPLSHVYFFRKTASEPARPGADSGN